LSERGDDVARRPPNSHLTAEVGGLRPGSLSMRDVVMAPTRSGSLRTDGMSRRSISRRPPWLTPDRRPTPPEQTSPDASPGSRPIWRVGFQSRVVTTWWPASTSTLRDRWRKWCGGWGPQSRRANSAAGRAPPVDRRRGPRRPRLVRSRSRSKPRSRHSMLIGGKSRSPRIAPGSVGTGVDAVIRARRRPEVVPLTSGARLARSPTCAGERGCRVAGRSLRPAQRKRHVRAYGERVNIDAIMGP